MDKIDKNYTFSLWPHTLKICSFFAVSIAVYGVIKSVTYDGTYELTVEPNFRRALWSISSLLGLVALLQVNRNYKKGFSIPGRHMLLIRSELRNNSTNSFLVTLFIVLAISTVFSGFDKLRNGGFAESDFSVTGSSASVSEIAANLAFSVSASLYAGIVEEFTYCIAFFAVGVLLIEKIKTKRGHRKKTPKRLYVFILVLLSAATRGFGHYYQGGMERALLMMALGVSVCLVFLWLKSITGVIAAHAIFDASIFTEVAPTMSTLSVFIVMILTVLIGKYWALRVLGGGHRAGSRKSRVS